MISILKIFTEASKNIFHGKIVLKLTFTEGKLTKITQVREAHVLMVE